MKPKDLKRAKDIVVEMTLLKTELGSLGLWKTFHKMDAATQSIGWELAEKMEEK